MQPRSARLACAFRHPVKSPDCALCVPPADADVARAAALNTLSPSAPLSYFGPGKNEEWKQEWVGEYSVGANCGRCASRPTSRLQSCRLPAQGLTAVGFLLYRALLCHNST